MGVHLLREGFQPAFKRRLDQGVCCSVEHKEPGCPAIALESAQLILHTLVTDSASDLSVEEDHGAVDVIVGNAVAQQPWCVPLGAQSILGHVADFQVGPVGLECMEDHLLVRSPGNVNGTSQYTGRSSSNALHTVESASNTTLDAL